MRANRHFLIAEAVSLYGTVNAQDPAVRAGSLLSGSGRMAAWAYIIISAIPANTPPSTISVNSVPETIALSMDMPRVNIGEG